MIEYPHVFKGGGGQQCSSPGWLIMTELLIFIPTYCFQITLKFLLVMGVI